MTSISAVGGGGHIPVAGGEAGQEASLISQIENLLNPLKPGHLKQLGKDLSELSSKYPNNPDVKFVTHFIDSLGVGKQYTLGDLIENPSLAKNVDFSTGAVKQLGMLGSQLIGALGYSIRWPTRKPPFIVAATQFIIGDFSNLIQQHDFGGATSNEINGLIHGIGLLQKLVQDNSYLSNILKGLDPMVKAQDPYTYLQDHTAEVAQTIVKIQEALYQ